MTHVLGTASVRLLLFGAAIAPHWDRSVPKIRELSSYAEVALRPHAQQCYVLVQQLSQISFRVPKKPRDIKLYQEICI